MVSEQNQIAVGADRATDPAIRTFETLDGLRGVAAIAVVIWHLKVDSFMTSAYLAVDLFFILSGFVIAYRYENKLLGPMVGSRFMTMRMIRLYPLYLLGSIIGASWKLRGILMRSAHRLPGLIEWGKHVGLAIAMLPNLLTKGLVYPFNIPAWSLFYEVIVNAIYGFTRRRTTNAVLAVIILLSAMALAWAVLVYGNMRFTVRMPEFLIGAFRALFGFYVGIALFRLREAGRLPEWRIPPILIAVLLILFLSIPRTGPAAPWLTLAVVFIAFPLLVIAALSNEPSGVLARVFAYLGLLSFPLYAIHRPIISIIHHYGHVLHLGVWPTSIAAVAISMGLSALALRYYDKPVRHQLTRVLMRPAAKAVPA